MAQRSRLIIPDMPEFILDEAQVLRSNMCMGEEFRTRFFGKKEEDVPGGWLLLFNITQDLQTDEPIRAALGVRAKVAVAHFCWMLTGQSQGEIGRLYTAIGTNLFYLTDKEGNDCTVRGWFFDPAPNEGRWIVDVHSAQHHAHPWQTRNLVATYGDLATPLTF